MKKTTKGGAFKWLTASRADVCRVRFLLMAETGWEDITLGWDAGSDYIPPLGYGPFWEEKFDEPQR